MLRYSQFLNSIKDLLKYAMQKRNFISLKVLQCTPLFIFTMKKGCENRRGGRGKTKPSKHSLTLLLHGSCILTQKQHSYILYKTEQPPLRPPPTKKSLNQKVIFLSFSYYRKVWDKTWLSHLALYQNYKVYLPLFFYPLT